MPLAIRLPRNRALIAELGPYPSHLQVLNPAATAVQRRLRREGLAGYESLVQATLLALCEQKTEKLVFYDVGAHIGLYVAMVSAIFHRANPTCYAFEPTPGTSALCDKLRKRNRLNFTVIRKAVSSRQGEMVLYLSPKGESSNSLNRSFRPGAAETRVETLTLDTFVQSGAPLPNVIKIDVETHEPEVLIGAQNLIRDARPWIVCEFLKATDPTKLRKALSFLKSLDYRFHRSTDPPPYRDQSVDEVVSNLSNTKRDWLLAPSAIDHALFEKIERWREAIKSCDAATNVFFRRFMPMPARCRREWR
jgi:FkbM family methyltransferase